MKPVAAFCLACLLPSAAWAEGLEFAIANKTGAAVAAVHIAPLRSSDWQDNVLSGEVESGRKGKATRADAKGQCEFDLRIVFADKTEILEEAVNLCGNPTHVLKPF